MPPPHLVFTAAVNGDLVGLEVAVRGISDPTGYAESPRHRRKSNCLPRTVIPQNDAQKSGKK